MSPGPLEPIGVQFEDGLAPASALAELVHNRIGRWKKVRNLLLFFPRITNYWVLFRRREEIFGLIECRIRVQLGESHWGGSALGPDALTSFNEAYDRARFTRSSVSCPIRKAV